MCQLVRRKAPTSAGPRVLGRCRDTEKVDDHSDGDEQENSPKMYLISKSAPVPLIRVASTSMAGKLPMSSST